jgi:hypothetical protein
MQYTEIRSEVERRTGGDRRKIRMKLFSDRRDGIERRSGIQRRENA